MTMRASLIITAKEQASAALGKVAAGARAVSAAFKPVQQEAAAADRAISKVADGAVLSFQRIRVGSNVSFRPMLLTAHEARGVFARLGDAARKMSGNLRSAEYRTAAFRRAVTATGQSARSAASGMARWSVSVARSVRDMRLGTRAAYGLGYAIGWTVRKSAGLALSAAKWSAIGLAGSATYAAGSFLGGMIGTASQFEQFQAQLEGTEGSVQKAKAAMNWVAKFAVQTPYAIDEVTDAFVRARGVGIDPLTGAMTKMGDAAAANRKTLMDAVEAVADAQTGEFERLKAFNITTSVKGDTVSFAYIDKAGKNAVKSAKKNAVEIQKAVLSIWDERHGGAMIRQSKTFAGIWANLTDAVTMFQLKIADKGIFQRVKDSLASLLDYADKLADNGTLDRWAQAISDRLSEAWEAGTRFVKGIDWDAVVTGAGRLVSTLATIVGWIGKAARTWKEWQLSVEIKKQEGIANGWFTSSADKAQARANIFRMRLEQQEMNAPAAAPEVRKGGSKPKWMQGTIGALANDNRIWQPSKALAAPAAKPSGVLKPGSKAVAPWTPRTSGSSAARQTAAPKQIVQTQRIVNDVKVSGGVEVSVRAAPGLIASTTRLSSNNRNVPLTAKTGKTMAEAA